MTMLLTDTNILLRCSRGRAMRHVSLLFKRGVALATTDRNAAEMLDRLTKKFGLAEDVAKAEVSRVLTPFIVLAGDEYQHLAAAADRRLREGGKPDWPLLAAAMALDGEIWSEDIDFLGVGIPVWSTANVQFSEAEPA